MYRLIKKFKECSWVIEIGVLEGRRELKKWRNLRNVKKHFSAIGTVYMKGGIGNLKKFEEMFSGHWDSSV